MLTDPVGHGSKVISLQIPREHGLTLRHISSCIFVT